jgi:hypothetical protein
MYFVWLIRNGFETVVFHILGVFMCIGIISYNEKTENSHS